MAMNKKEQAELEELRKQLAIAKAFRFTEPVERDVQPPESYSALATGWVYNEYNCMVSVACSNSVHHAVGRTDKTNTQRPISMYSSKLLALKGLRNALEQKYAKALADIDAQIEKEREALAI